MRTRLTGLALLATLVAGCGSSADKPQASAKPQGFTVISRGDLGPGMKVPAPHGPVVLTVRGRIANTNAPGRSLRFDMPTLERLGLVEYRATDKVATGGRPRFRGVLLRRLLAVAGVPATTRTVHTTALNDYAVNIPTADAARWPVLIATTADGRRMPVAKYGPTRIVYPYGNFSGLDTTTHDPRSIWQLKTIVVR